MIADIGQRVFETAIERDDAAGDLFAALALVVIGGNASIVNLETARTRLRSLS